MGMGWPRTRKGQEYNYVNIKDYQKLEDQRIFRDKKSSETRNRDRNVL